MSEDWRDHEPGRRGVSVAQLSDGEAITAQILSNPYRQETEQSQDALHVPCVFVGEIPDGFTDMSGEEIQEGEEYNIINSSTAFFNALLSAFPEGNDPTGEVIEITGHQPADAYSRYYSVELV